MTKKTNNKKRNAKNPRDEKRRMLMGEMVKRRDRLRKLGFTTTNTGNIVVPQGSKTKFHAQLLKNGDVLKEFVDQRKGQMGGGGGAVEGSVIDEIIELEQQGFDMALLADLVGADENQAEVDVVSFEAPLRINTLRKFASGPVLDAIHHGIGVVHDFYPTPEGNFSLGELAYLRLLLEAFYYARGDIPTLQLQDPVVNRWLSLLTPRSCTNHIGIQFSFMWAGMDNDFVSFFADTDFYPLIANSVCVGKLTVQGQNTDSRAIYAPGITITEEFVLEFGTPAYMKLITQLSDAGQRTLVDPLEYVVEKSMPHAWSVPTGFGAEDSSFRYWASVRSPFRLASANCLPYACTGFVDSANLNINEELWPVRTIQFVNTAHYLYQLNHSHTMDPHRSHAYLVYPKCLFIEQVIRRAAYALIVADVKITEVLVDYNADSLVQADNSVLHGITSEGFAQYMSCVLSDFFYDNWVGAYTVPLGVNATCGTVFAPNPKFRLSPVILQLTENLEMLGASIKGCVDDFGHQFQRVTLPVPVVDGSYNMTNIVGNNLSNFIFGLYPGISVGGITYATSNSTPNDLLPVGVPSPSDPLAVRCVTIGTGPSGTSVSYSIMWNTVQPALVLSLLGGMHNPKTFNYDSTTRLVSTNGPVQGIPSAYQTFHMEFALYERVYKWLVAPQLLDIVPVFMIGQRNMPVEEMQDAAAMVASIFRQAKKIAYLDAYELLQSLGLATIDCTYASHAVGSKYQPPKTGLCFIAEHRLVEGGGSFWALIKPGLDGLTIAAELSSELMEFLGHENAAEVLRKIGNVSRTARKYVAPMEHGVLDRHFAMIKGASPK